MQRSVWAEIDLDALCNNVREIRRITNPRAQVMAIVKANAYGHGAMQVSRVALRSGADWLGVARSGGPGASSAGDRSAHPDSWLHSG